VAGADLTGRSHAVHPGHAQVHEDHIRVALRRQLNRFDAVSGQSDDFCVVEAGHDGGQPLPDDPLVVDDQHPHGVTG
jgi:hypothetical protein